MNAIGTNNAGPSPFFAEVGSALNLKQIEVYNRAKMQNEAMHNFRRKLRQARRNLGKKMGAVVRMPHDVSNIIIDYCFWTRHMITAYEWTLRSSNIWVGLEISCDERGTLVTMGGNVRFYDRHKISAWYILRDCDRLVIDHNDYNRVLDDVRNAYKRNHDRIAHYANKW